jgi:hypothetical protein
VCPIGKLREPPYTEFDEAFYDAEWTRFKQYKDGGVMTVSDFVMNRQGVGLVFFFLMMMSHVYAGLFRTFIYVGHFRTFICIGLLRKFIYVGRLRTFLCVGRVLKFIYIGHVRANLD